MVKNGARRSFARGCVRCGRIAGRLAGSIATMILGAAVLGGAIAGAEIMILGEAGSSVAQRQAVAAVGRSFAGVAPDGLMEARSAWVEGKQRAGHVRRRCLGAVDGSTEMEVGD